MHNFEMHLSVISKMLPYFGAAGRGQYAKALRLYLEQMKLYDLQYGALIKTFKVAGLHTVRYTGPMSGLAYGQTYRSNNS